MAAALGSLFKVATAADAARGRPGRASSHDVEGLDAWPRPPA